MSARAKAGARKRTRRAVKRVKARKPNRSSANRTRARVLRVGHMTSPHWAELYDAQTGRWVRGVCSKMLARYLGIAQTRVRSGLKFKLVIVK